MDLRRLLAGHPALTRPWIASCAARLAASNMRLLHLLDGSLHERLAKLLLTQAVDGGVPLAQHVLAAMLGVGRPRRPMAPEFGLSIDVPELVLEGEPVTIMAQATDERLALCATVTGEDGVAAGRPTDFTRGVATLEGLRPGTYKVTVGAAARTVRGLDPVTDAFTVWPRSEV